MVGHSVQKLDIFDKETGVASCIYYLCCVAQVSCHPSKEVAFGEILFLLIDFISLSTVASKGNLLHTNRLEADQSM